MLSPTVIVNVDEFVRSVAAGPLQNMPSLPRTADEIEQALWRLMHDSHDAPN